MSFAQHDTAFRNPGSTGHLVLFYREEKAFLESVGAFIAPVLQQGGRALMLPTAPHLAGIEGELAAAKIDTSAARSRGDLVVVDARDTLEEMATGGMLDDAKAEKTVTELLEKHFPADGRPFRVYGEIVDLLMRARGVSQASRLEQVWIRQMQERKFPALCSYLRSSFLGLEGREAHKALCNLHSHVLSA